MTKRTTASAATIFTKRRKVMKILHLTLRRKWFDMIASGEKKEEYREFKDYWLKRLSDFFTSSPFSFSFHEYDVIRFRNGYSNEAPIIDVECLGIITGLPRPEWSDNAKGNHIIIKLGKIISTSNYALPTK